MASWDEARKCPRCETPGKEVGTRPDGAGGKVVMLACQNGNCVWLNERFIVQVRHDGTIPDPQTTGPKAFPDMPKPSEDEFEAIRQALRFQQEQMTKPGGEASSSN